MMMEVLLVIVLGRRLQFHSSVTMMSITSEGFDWATMIMMMMMLRTDVLDCCKLVTPGHLLWWSQRFLFTVNSVLRCFLLLAVLIFIFRRVHHLAPVLVDLVDLVLPGEAVLGLIKCGQEIKNQICLLQVPAVALLEVLLLHDCCCLLDYHSDTQWDSWLCFLQFNCFFSVCLRWMKLINNVWI